MNQRPFTHWQRMGILAGLIVASWGLVISAALFVFWMVQP